MYRLNFKTLRFSSKKQILHNFAIIQSRKKIQKKKKKKKKHKFCVYQQSMEIKSYAYEVFYIHNALREWRVHSFISL